MGLNDTGKDLTPSFSCCQVGFLRGVTRKGPRPNELRPPAEVDAHSQQKSSGRFPASPLLL